MTCSGPFDRREVLGLEGIRRSRPTRPAGAASGRLTRHSASESLRVNTAAIRRLGCSRARIELGVTFDGENPHRVLSASTRPSAGGEWIPMHEAIVAGASRALCD